MASGLQPAYSGAGDITKVIRPAAVVPESSASAIIKQLSMRDVARGGVWNVSPTIWQRYSGAWDGPCNTRGAAELVGSIAVAYETPVRNHITIYRVTITEAGQKLGWTLEELCDEALGYGGGAPEAGPRAQRGGAPLRAPFQR